jgi:hypothetical protein
VVRLRALSCNTRDDRNFKGYPLRKNFKPYVVSLAWRLPAARAGLMLLILLSEDESSRTQLIASGVSYAPQALGIDIPPPPPPGRPRDSVSHWIKVSSVRLYKEGGRYLGFDDEWPRDLLFELPAGSASPDALSFRAIINRREYAVRCELGNQTEAPSNIG